MNWLQNLSGYFNPILQGIGTGIGSSLSRLPQQLGSWLGNPTNLLGAGLIGAGYGMDKEPGYLTEARQYQRNLFTSPEAIAQGMAGQVGAMQQYYEPLMLQNEKAVLDNAQQRVIAGQPASFSTAMGGNEVAAIRNATVNQLVPARQAMLADLSRENLNRQARASEVLLGEGYQNKNAEALSRLGAALLTGGQGGGGGYGIPGTTGQPGSAPWGTGGGAAGGGASWPGGMGGIPGQNGTMLSGVGQLGSLAGLFTGGNALQQGLGLLPGAAAGAFQTLSPQAGQALVQSVQGLLGGATVGGFEQVGSGAVAILDQSGNIIGGILPSGDVINGTTGQLAGNLASGQGGLASSIANFQGLLGAPGFGSVGGVLSGLGSAAGGGYLGYQVGQLLPNQSTGALAGAGTGALTGFAVGGPIGAAVGGIAGLFGGLFGARQQQQMEKAQRLSADMASQQNNVGATAAFWTPALAAAGIDPSGFAQFAQQQVQNTPQGPTAFSYGGYSGTLDQAEAIAYVGARTLLQAIQQVHPEYTSLDQVPNFRTNYIDYLMQHLKIESDGGLSPVSSVGQFGSYLTSAGLGL